MSTTLSVIIIAENEEERIVRCLKSVAFADERIVVDNGSKDQTGELAKQHGAKVITVKGKDFAALRESGLKEAAGTWILYIDADEEVTQALQKEIQNVIQKKKYEVYFITRETYFLGYHWPYRDMVERLFLKSALKGWRGRLHETPVYAGQTAILVHPLIHRTHRSLEQMVEKTNEWSVIEAELRYKGGHPPVVWWRFIRVMITGFWRSYITMGGWRAGTVGLIESIYQAFSMFITYAKLWELQQRENGK